MDFIHMTLAMIILTRQSERSARIARDFVMERLSCPANTMHVAVHLDHRRVNPADIPTLSQATEKLHALICTEPEIQHSHLYPCPKDP